MELFRLLGKIAIDNSEANKALKDTSSQASSTADDVKGSSDSIKTSNKSTESSWTTLKSKVNEYKAQGMSTSQAWRQASMDMKASTETASTGMVSALKKIGVAVITFLAVDKIINFGSACLQAAADLQAMESQFSQVFGNIESDASAALTRVAEQGGIAENRLKGSFTKIAAFAKTTGMDTADAMNLSERAMIAVADSAAFYDRSIEETTESLQSFLKGNYENDSALGLSCTETTRNAAANKLYGKSFNELSESQKQLTLLQMVEDANKTSGALGQAARESDTWSNVLGNLQQGWKDFQAVLGNAVLPTAIQIVKGMANAVSGLAEKTENAIQWAKEHESTIKLIGIAIGTVATAIAAYNIAINLATIMTKAHTIATTIATTATTALGSVIAFLTSPITLVILAIGALVAAVVVMYNKFDWFKNIVDGVISAIKTGLTAAIDFLKPYITDIGNAISELGSTIWAAIQGMVESFQNFITKVQDVYNSSNPIVEAIKEHFATTFENIKVVVTTTIDIIKTVITTWLEVIKSAIQVATSIIKGDWKGAWDGIKNITSTVLSGIKSVISSGFDGAKTVISNKLNGMKSTVQTVWNTIKSTISGAVDKIKGLMNFNWSIPKPKIPKFSVSGGKAPWGFGGEGSLPSISVKWHKDAMNSPMIMNIPTIFGYNPATGTYHGGGEAGSEMIGGTNTIMGMISDAVASQNEAVVYYLQKLIQILVDYFPQIIDGMDRPICFDSNRMAAELAVPIDKQLGILQMQKDRGR